VAVAPALPYLKRGRRRSSAAIRERSSSPTAAGWSSEGSSRIEIVAPDRYCTVLLLGYAPPLFDAEIVAGTEWIVRLQPPAGTGWVLELLALVERWLESARLPCAKLRYEGRSFVIRSSTEIAEFVAAVESSSAPAAGLMP
jgi:hypothetical protein